MEQQQKPNFVVKTRTFFSEVVAELKKSAWPTRGELMDSTVMVIVTMIILGAFVSLADVVFVNVVRFLTKA